MTKTLNQIIFFPPPKSEYFFQQHWESEYVIRTPPPPPPPPPLQVKWSFPKHTLFNVFINDITKKFYNNKSTPLKLIEHWLSFIR